jgi:hydrogenase maturation protein HypF
MTWRLLINGQVQGVGFRPMVYREAKRFSIPGLVSNTPSGVEVVFNTADESAATRFSDLVLKNIPANSIVTDCSLQIVASQDFEYFQIAASESAMVNTVQITPDLALCSTCRRELHTPGNRRYRYAFTSCTCCGPRYSIMQQLPYDRPETTMRDFAMCAACSTEYNDPDDRRFYAQTISCSDCGPTISLFQQDQPTETNEAAITGTIQLLLSGKIVAVKGTGGYLLMCDATDAEAIGLLRKKKNRPAKPLAVMYPDEDKLRQDVLLHNEALEWLKGPVAPIVLLSMIGNPMSGIAASIIAPGLPLLGVMLPNTPLLELIAAGANRPLIATSANISHAPIIYQDEAAMRDLFEIADAILTHDLEIAVPQDDSVMRFAESGRPVILRRSRGMAPVFFPRMPFPNRQILAMGAQLKSTLSLLQAGKIYLSQYIGDLENFETVQHFQFLTQHLLQLTGMDPELILCDLHPGYTSTQLGQQMAANLQIPLIKIQHHEAHFAAVLAENGLHATEEPVLGVIWDGTGYGSDGKIWGSEFFLWESHKMERIGHLAYYPSLAGDKMAKEPRLSALSVTPAEYRNLLSPRFTTREWTIYTALLAADTLQTSSMGRLFDAVAAWCGYTGISEYEGAAALWLETAATMFLKQRKDYFESYPIEFENKKIHTTALVIFVIEDVRNGVNPAEIAARFHCTLVNIIRDMADANGLKQIAFSGGVFQNALLVSLIEKYLGEDFYLFFHRQLSPNDECISFGQLAHWELMH